MSIETTIQSLYFHDNTSIYSICSSNKHIYTAGGDSKIRSWHIKTIDTNKEKELSDFIVTTPIDSSVKISYCETFEGHKKTINCIKYFEINSISYLISCDDDGKIFLWIINDCKYEYYQIYSTDPCQEIMYINKEDMHYILCGLETGKLILLNLIIKKHKPKIKLIQIIKPHSLSIDGLAYNNIHNIISTLSKDATCKLFQLKKGKLVLFENLKKMNLKYNFLDENKVILVRRHKFSDCGNFLHLTSCEESGKYVLLTLRYPFHENCIYKTITNLKEPVIKIIENKLFGIIFFSNYNCFIPKYELLIKDCVLNPIIDACFYDNLILIASLDGFITTIRFN